MKSKLSRNRKLAIAGLLLVACVGGGSVIAQLYFSLFGTGQWSVASSQIQFKSNYWYGGSYLDCADFGTVSGSITGDQNQTFSMASIPYILGQEIDLQEVVAVHRIAEDGVAIDLVWSGDDLTLVGSELVKLELWGYLNEQEGSTKQLIAHWDNSTGAFVLDYDYNFPTSATFTTDYLVLGLKYCWVGTPLPFSFTIQAEAV